jgi:hypothetical protein
MTIIAEWFAAHGVTVAVVYAVASGSLGVVNTVVSFALKLRSARDWVAYGERSPVLARVFGVMRAAGIDPVTTVVEVAALIARKAGTPPSGPPTADTTLQSAVFTAPANPDSTKPEAPRSKSSRPPADRRISLVVALTVAACAGCASWMPWVKEGCRDLTEACSLITLPDGTKVPVSQAELQVLATAKVAAAHASDGGADAGAR